MREGKQPGRGSDLGRSCAARPRLCRLVPFGVGLLGLLASLSRATMMGPQNNKNRPQMGINSDLNRLGPGSKLNGP